MNKIITSVLLLLSFSQAAFADPIGLRNNITDKNSTSITLGWKESSIGIWVTPYIGLSAEIALPFNSLAATVATRSNLLGREYGFGVDSFISTGLVFPTIESGLAFSLTPAIKARYKGESFSISAGLVSPSLFQVSKKLQSRLPVMLELSFLKGFNENKVSIGLQASSGFVFIPGLSPSLDFQGSLLLNFL